MSREFVDLGGSERIIGGWRAAQGECQQGREDGAAFGVGCKLMAATKAW